ncbi:MAG: hypothetical protein F4228_14070 [Acidobacteria bacterium]|nr:hypothetical protein [Acidobacteriota bacterium]MYF15820.1 hypothetical protein [Acidobacteriota bacterium]MYI96283.1 hypothetical protein [Acidobacteriota bacterium]
MGHADGTQARAPNDTRHLFFDVLDWLRNTYRTHRFFTERDVVWTVQKRLLHEAASRNLHYRVFHNDRMTKGEAKSAPADLVLVDPEDRAHLAIEFKYEPDHQRVRKEFPASKFPVVDWKEVTTDIERVQEFVREGFTLRAVSVFVDEGGHFRRRPAPRGSRWEDWDLTGCDYSVSVLISEA